MRSSKSDFKGKYGYRLRRYVDIYKQPFFLKNAVLLGVSCLFGASSKKSPSAEGLVKDGFVAVLFVGDVAAHSAGVKLAWAADFVFGVANHFVQLGNPADGASQGEDAREQFDRNADGALHDA